LLRRYADYRGVCASPKSSGCQGIASFVFGAQVAIRFRLADDGENTSDGGTDTSGLPRHLAPRAKERR